MMDEELSALADSELDGTARTQALTRLAAEPARREAWSRAQLIGTTLRRGLPEAFDGRLAERVMTAIGDEQPEPGAAPLALPESGGRRWLKPLAGAAIAASVAAVALVGLRGLDPVLPSNPQVLALGVPATPLQQARVQPVSAELDRERLSLYLQRHNEFVTQSGVNGVLPYVRVVSQERMESRVR